MQIVDKMDAWYGKRVVRGVFLVIVALVGYLLFFTGGDVTPEEQETVKLPSVTVASAANTSGDSTFNAVGTLQAVSEAKLQTEAGGRIVGVYTELGATVRAGTIIARLEGASESAQLLQAQGAYEAALAGAASGEVGVAGAENALAREKKSAVSTHASVYNSISGIIKSDIDKYFSNPNSTIPGLRLVGYGRTEFLNSERVAMRGVLTQWQTSAANLKDTDNLPEALTTARANTARTLAIVDALVEIIPKQSSSGQAEQAENRAEIAAITATRAQVIGILESVDAAISSLESAERGLEQAKIADSNGTVSASGAQIKIALGSLRAAQANYEKTLVRTPITGVVNALYLKAGEYAGPSTPAAIIANNNQGLEVSTSVSQEESVLIKVGDEVLIDKVAKGTIAAIGGSIDPTTGKVAVKISVDENSSLQNGSAVSVVFTTEKSSDTSEISIPLSAVKMTGSGPIVFTVDADKNTLIANPIVLGNIRGEVVVVTSGINRDTPIVTDGRGLKEGSEVTIETK